VARMEETRNAYKIFVKSEGEILYVRPRVDGRY